MVNFSSGGPRFVPKRRRWGALITACTGGLVVADVKVIKKLADMPGRKKDVAVQVENP